MGRGDAERDVEPSDDDRHEEAVEEAEEVRAKNPDPVTQREAVELELEEEGLTDEGATIGDEID